MRYNLHRSFIVFTHYMYYTTNHTKRFHRKPFNHMMLISVIHVLPSDSVVVLLVCDAPPQTHTVQRFFTSCSADLHFMCCRNTYHVPWLAVWSSDKTAAALLPRIAQIRLPDRRQSTQIYFALSSSVQTFHKQIHTEPDSAALIYQRVRFPLPPRP